MPNVPTAVESGYPKFVTESWYGIWAPKGTPNDRVEILNKAANDAVRQLTKAGAFAPLGIEPVLGSVDDFKNTVKATSQKTQNCLKILDSNPSSQYSLGRTIT